MTTGNPRSPKLEKGALMRLSESLVGPEINIIVFQFNPEELTRRFAPWQPALGEGGSEAEGSDRAQPFDPGETISMTLEFHAADDMEVPAEQPVRAVSGVADRLAALEMLLYPDKGGGALEVQVPEGASLSGGGGGRDEVQRIEVPVVLLSWGQGRVLPVRLTDLEITEQLFSPALHPIQATASVELSVLTPEALKGGESAPESAELARAAYEYTREKKIELAESNAENAADSGAGELPF